MKRKITALIDRVDIRSLLCVVFIANIIDAYLTLTWIEAGVATEANPIMAELLHLGTHWFWIGKVGTVTFACLFLWICRHVRASKLVAFVSCIVYITVIGIHAKGAYDLNLLSLF